MNESMKAWKGLAVAAVFLVAGCATNAQQGISSAATTPLSDLNIVRADVPEVLEQAQKEPYALPVGRSCTTIAAQVMALDEVLGADLDTPPSESNPGLIERGNNFVTKQAIGALQRTAEGVVPFRSWVRKLSGAEKYSKHVAAAIAAGTVRRAFLKGVGASQGCPSAASAQMAAATK